MTCNTVTCIPVDTLTGNESYEYTLDCQTTVISCVYYRYYLLRGPEMYALPLLKTPGQYVAYNYYYHNYYAFLY